LIENPAVYDNDIIMREDNAGNRIPALLVHGWNSHPGIWNKLTPLLKEASIPVWTFDHTGMAGDAIPEIAAAIGDYVATKREETGYYGKIDVVCHSVGTCITRYYLEVVDGDRKSAKVRQLIGLGPPNSGSALAELFLDPHRGEEVLNRLTGIFVPRGYDPQKDRTVHDVRTTSPVMDRLRTAGIRPDVTYRVIVTGNPDRQPEFFPTFEGRTWEQGPDGRYRTTYEGDGVVPHRESALPGITLDIILPEPDCGMDLLQPGQYCHIHLPRNPVVMARVLDYLTLPVID
jgi:pimeloyl-ACP methyl ester carboxylesterase